MKSGLSLRLFSFEMHHFYRVYPRISSSLNEQKLLWHQYLLTGRYIHQLSPSLEPKSEVISVQGYDNLWLISYEDSGNYRFSWSTYGVFAWADKIFSFAFPGLYTYLNSQDRLELVHVNFDCLDLLHPTPDVEWLLRILSQVSKSCDTAPRHVK